MKDFQYEQFKKEIIILPCRPRASFTRIFHDRIKLVEEIYQIFLFYHQINFFLRQKNENAMLIVIRELKQT